VFHFQGRYCPLRDFIKEVVGAAGFLRCRSSEREIVDRILINLPPDILAQAAFLPRPGSCRDMVGLLEDRMAVLAEHKRPDMDSSSYQKGEGRCLSENKPGGAADDGKPSSRNGTTFWRCGKQGHVQRNCRCCS
jgi:hypothetical protein